MSVLVAGDYQDALSKPAPQGLVADPPNYNQCTSVAKRVSAHPAPTETLTKLCRQLYEAAKLQAMSFLIDANWHILDAREHGEAVTTHDLDRNLEQVEEQERKSTGANYLSTTRRSKADELYLLQRNILTRRFLAGLRRKAGGQVGNQQALAKLVQEWYAKWTARTSCDSGYVTDQCKQYKASQPNPPAPNEVLQQLIGH